MERMALVGKITSSIAHSIRNPLMAIGGFARSLLKGTGENDPKRETLASIVRESRQLEEALEEVLNYSDSLYPTLDSWDVNQLVSSVCRGLHEAFDARRVACRLRLAADLPQTRIDYRQVSYCVKTILTSAIEAMPAGGEIRIDTWREGGWVVVAIQETGSAVTPQSLEEMMTPFGSTQQLGSGLGLAICKTIMDRHGNPFEVQPLPDGGARYNIKLPVNSEEMTHG